LVGNKILCGSRYDLRFTFCVGSFYPDNSGGPNITMYWLAKALHQQGVDVIVLTTDKGIGDKFPSGKWVNTDFGKVQYVQTSVNTIPLTLFFKCIIALRNTKNIYLASFFYPLSFLLAPIAILMGVNVIWGPRGETSLSALKYGRRRKRFVLLFIRLIKKRIVFHATSAAEVNDIKKLLGDCRVVLIEVGMEIPEQQNAPVLPQNLLFLGRIHPIKGLENLLQAIAISPFFLKSKHHLIIAGYAQIGYDEVLKKLAAKLGISHKIEFIGRVDGEAKEILLAACYALVLPSFSENFGAVVAEALAQGTPVIASKGTPWEILENYGAGYHAENEPIILAGAIEKIFTLDDKKYKLMRLNARSLAEQELDVNRYVKHWKSILI
jgi:glycosyltransferase involved in cell wall biosynthesis